MAVDRAQKRMLLAQLRFNGTVDVAESLMKRILKGGVVATDHQKLILSQL